MTCAMRETGDLEKGAIARSINANVLHLKHEHSPCGYIAGQD